MSKNKTKQIKFRVYRAASAVDEGAEVVDTLMGFPQGASFSQIHKKTQLNPNTLTRKLWRLMEEGIVERSVMKPDEKRRYSFYKLTPQGKSFIEKLEELEAIEQKNENSPE